MTDVVLMGEPMGLFMAQDVGLFEEVDNFKKGIAGAEVNVAIGLSRLGFDVSYVSKLGKDPIGNYILNYIIKEKINSEYVIFDDESNTGLQIKNKVSKDDPAVFYYRKNSAFSNLKTFELDNIDFTKVRLFHITGIPLAINKETRKAVYELAKRAKEAGCLITFDPNLRMTLWKDFNKMVEVINEISKYADVVMPGISEGKVLTGYSKPKEIADYYKNIGVKTVIIKDGEKGAYLKEENKEIYLVSGIKVETVVDTVGAGDGFAVGVISGLLEGLSIYDCVRRGNVIGSIQVQHQSDNEALPSREELLSYGVN